MQTLKRLVLVTFLFNLTIGYSQNGTVKSFHKIKKTDSGFSGIDFTNLKYLGKSVTNIGDIDKDGNPDIALGIYDKNKSEGAVLICFLNNNGTVKSTVEISKGKGGLPTNFTPEFIEGFGISITGIGDFDKDGVNDIAVGNYGLTTNFQGEVYLLFLNANGTVKNYKRIAEGVNFSGQLDQGDSFGGTISNIGDLDKDGVIDIVVGASGDSDMGKSKGAIWILFLNPDGSVKSYKKLNAGNALLSSLQVSDAFGWSVGAIGDIDNDNVADIAVSAAFSDEGGMNRGSVRILLMNSDGSIKSVAKISQTTGNFTDSLNNNILFGDKVCLLGDMDGDGVNDISVSSSVYKNNTGIIWNLFLKSDGTCKSFQKITSNTGGFNVSLNSGDAFGAGLGWAGDLNGDGIYDLLTSAIGDNEVGASSGALYILYLNGASHLSAENIYKDNFTIYPNPVSNNININNPLVGEDINITISNITGINVVERKENNASDKIQLYLPNLNSGVYMLRLQNNNTTYFQKLIIN